MNRSILLSQVRFVEAMRAWIVALGLVLPSFANAQALIYLVGGDAACDFTTIQAALNAAAAHAGPDVIHRDAPQRGAPGHALAAEENVIIARGAGGVGPHYNASKASMEGMTRGYAARLVKDGITVNAVAPSLIETDMVRSGVAFSPARIPLGRFGTPEECAQAVLMVIGNAYMTGQTIALSGGLSFV